MSRPARLVLVLLVLVVVAVAATVGALLLAGERTVPSRQTILEIDFETAFLEYQPDDPLSALFLERRMRLRDVVEALEAAADDDRVAALVARVTPSSLGYAQTQELRAAILAFRASGKPAYAYADTFGEYAPGNTAYYLATAFDRIYLQPSGDLGLTGLFAETPFVRETLEKIGVEPRMDHRYEYKNAMNTYTERGLTPAHRESMQALVDSIHGQLVAAIAEARELDEAAVAALIDRGPFLGQEAVDAGLVDALAYRDEVYAEVEGAADDGAELLFLDHYWQQADRPYDRGSHTIALIYGVGAVVRGENQYDPFQGSFLMGGDAVAAAFRAAVEDDEVEAILFRVDSPGGSYVASDTIWRETVRAREAGKPVIVSMGDLAGSGGYFVAMAADKVVAHPATLTGSIGVYGGKLVTAELWQKLGVSWDAVQAGEHADMWSMVEDFDPDEWVRHQAWLDRVYQDFTAKVAEGRGLPLDRVREIAKGRVWTGEDARELGLVDALGGYRTALELAREAAGIEPDATVQIREFPRPRSAFDALFGEAPRNSREKGAEAALARAVAALRPVARLAAELGLAGPERAVLSMPPVEVAN